MRSAATAFLPAIFALGLAACASSPPPEKLEVTVKEKHDFADVIPSSFSTFDSALMEWESNENFDPGSPTGESSRT